MRSFVIVKRMIKVEMNEVLERYDGSMCNCGIFMFRMLNNFFFLLTQGKRRGGTV